MDFCSFPRCLFAHGIAKPECKILSLEPMWKSAVRLKDYKGCPYMPHSPANLATSRATRSGTSGVLFLGLHVLLATVAPNATRGNHGLLFQGSMCRHNRLKLWCTDGSGSLTSAELDTAATTLHSATFACSVGFHTAISQLKFTCVLSWYGKWQANKSQHIDNVPHQAKHSNQLSAAIFKHRLFLGVYVLQAV